LPNVGPAVAAGAKDASAASSVSAERTCARREPRGQPLLQQALSTPTKRPTAAATSALDANQAANRCCDTCCADGTLKDGCPWNLRYRRRRDGAVDCASYVSPRSTAAVMVSPVARARRSTFLTISVFAMCKAIWIPCPSKHAQYTLRHNRRPAHPETARRGPIHPPTPPHEEGNSPSSVQTPRIRREPAETLPIGQSGTDDRSGDDQRDDRTREFAAPARRVQINPARSQPWSHRTRGNTSHRVCPQSASLARCLFPSRRSLHRKHGSKIYICIFSRRCSHARTAARAAGYRVGRIEKLC
jgi:hypothetical protein